MTPRVRIAAAGLGLFFLGIQAPCAKAGEIGPAGSQQDAVPGASVPASGLGTDYTGPDSGLTATPVLLSGSHEPTPQATTTAVLADGSASMQPAGVQGTIYGEATPQAVNGAQSNALRNYGSQVGQDWLKNTLGLDIQTMGIVWDPDTWTFVSAGDLASRNRGQGQGGSPSPLSSSASAPAVSKVTMQLEQSSDFSHLSEGVRDVPYNVEVKSAFRPVRSLSPIDTSLKIPLSPYDAWRADASMPMDFGPWWWRGLGLGRSLDLHSGFNSRQGYNQVETGMRTQWSPGFWGPWDLDYAWDLHYGEGSGDSTNWLKFSKEF